MAGLITEPGLCLKHACIKQDVSFNRLFKGRYRITEVDFVVRRPKDHQAQQWKACVRILYLFIQICKELYELYKNPGNCFLWSIQISIMEIIVSYTKIKN